MNKRIILTLLVSLCIFVAGCGKGKAPEPTPGPIDSNDTVQRQEDKRSDNNTSKVTEQNFDDSTYRLTEEVYTNKNVTVKYPQVINLDDTDMQKTINELIKSEALLDFSDGVDDDFELELDYMIQFKNANILSIQYSGVGYHKDAAHPTNWFFTSNIDMNRGEKVKLTDLFRIDETFVEYFKQGKYIGFGPENSSQSDQELESAVIEYINNIDTENLIGYLNESDNRSIEENPSNIFCYLTEDSIVVSIAVPHALGDHAKFQILTRNLPNNLNTESEFWRNIMKPSEW